MFDKEMTRYAFMSHMRDYMKDLLRDPIHARTSEFLSDYGIDGPVALKMLLKRSDPNDENSAIIVRSEKIKDNGFDENGKRNKDSFEIKYRIPRKDFNKKLRNLYINLFESNIVDGSPINEDVNMHEMPLSSTPYPFKDKSFGRVQSQCVPGSTGDRFAQYVNDNEKGYEPKLIDDEKENLTEGAWGYGILDSDCALDYQSEFAGVCIRVLLSRLQHSSDGQSLWANIGVLVDFLKKYKDDEIQLSDEYNEAIEVLKEYLMDILADEKFVNDWSEPEKFKSSVKKTYKDIALLKYQKEIMNDRQSLEQGPTPPIHEPVNEEGEAGGGTMDGIAGATSTSSSGQYTVPVFGKPIKRKTMYITQEQAEYLKEATATSNAGNYQYDVPMGSDNKFYKDTLDHSHMMERSWEGK